MKKANLLAKSVAIARKIPLLKPILLSPVIARPGYWLATGVGIFWGGILSLGRVQLDKGLIICRKLPGWSFGRGGTMVGAVFLTNSALSPAILEHEAVHKQQWKKYGLVFPILYFAEGLDPFQNRFEIEAGLELGGYRRPVQRPKP